jgi:hypothetical protein
MLDKMPSILRHNNIIPPNKTKAKEWIFPRSLIPYPTTDTFNKKTGMGILPSMKNRFGIERKKMLRCI